MAVRAPREPIPPEYANPLIGDALRRYEEYQVKYQILACQGQDILVGRLKLETPGQPGHAFMLRRYDSGAISLTTMFNVAFPTAPDSLQQSELNHYKQSYDLTGNNGSSRDTSIARLAGVWVSPALAVQVGKHYGIQDFVNLLATSYPDPKANYRRSGQQNTAPNTPAQQSEPPAEPPTPKSPATRAVNGSSRSAGAASSPSGPGPAKRSRRESNAASLKPKKGEEEEEKPVVATKPPSSRSAPRRSTRATKSPPPSKSAKPPSTASIMSVVSSSAAKPPSTRRSRRGEAAATTVVVKVMKHEDSGVIDEEADELEQEAVGNMYEEDVKEQKAMIKNMKAAAAAAKKDPTSPSKPKSKGSKATPAKAASKRSRTDQEETEEQEKQPLRFDFDKPAVQPDIAERQIATNKRVGYWQNVQPERKSFAWGVAAFFVGAGAVFLPNLF